MTRTRGSEKSCLVVALFAICLATTSVIAQGAQETPQAREVEGGPEGQAAEPEFSVPTTYKRHPEGKSPGFDALLRLPSGFVTTEPSAVAGAGESEWRRRFEKADSDLIEARASLERTKRELDGVAGAGGSSQWAITPPGGGGGNTGESGPTNSPMSFKLRQQLRGDRDRITVTERAMRELRIEADLAGVPQSWRASKSDSAKTRQELD